MSAHSKGERRKTADDFGRHRPSRPLRLLLDSPAFVSKLKAG
jgi:hypothetical protein